MSKKSFVFNLFWKFAERCGAQGVTFIVSVVLARLLEPELYGTIALVTVFIAILQVFVDSGLGNALVQKKDADDVDFSSVFFFNLITCATLYFLMYFLAPIIADFYNMMELVAVIRFMSLTLIVSGVKNVQQAYVAKNMLFKKFFYSTVGGTIGAAVLGIFLAYKGYGIWALAVQSVFNSTVDTIILWFTVKWRPKKCFSIKRLLELFKYGWKLLVSALIETGYTQLRTLIIGKIYSHEDLAYYSKADQFPSPVVTNINSSINSVLFPAMSKEQNDILRVRSMTRRSIKISSYIMMPLMIGMAACADNLVEFILTDKWMPCVPYIRIFCFSYAFYPVHTANLNAMNALGRSDLFLKLEIEKKIVGIIAIIATVRFGVFIMACSSIVCSIINQIINSAPNKKLLGYSYKDQMLDICSSIILASIMGVVVFLVGKIRMSCGYLLLTQIILGIVLYFVLSIVSKNENYKYIVSIVRDLQKRKGK